MISIGIVDNHPIYALGLRCVLNEHGSYKVFNIEHVCENILDRIAENRINILILVNSSEHSGYPPWHNIFSHICASANVLIIDNQLSLNRIKKYFQKGIVGYVLRSISILEFLETVEQISKGQHYVQKSVETTMTNIHLGLKRSSGYSENITKREKQVLGMIVDEWTTREIANKLYISFCTVETHRKHLMQKLGVKNTAGLVREALYNGHCS